jgi:hypothetical protein
VKRWLLILSAVIGIVLLWQAVSNLFATDEKLIRQLIATMKHAVERNKILTLNDCIASNYSDEHGLDKQSLLGAIRVMRSHYNVMFIKLSDMKVEVNAADKTARAEFTASVIAHRAGEGAKLTTDADHVRLFFRKADDGWKLVRAEYPEMEFK